MQVNSVTLFSLFTPEIGHSSHIFLVVEEELAGILLHFPFDTSAKHFYVQGHSKTREGRLPKGREEHLNGGHAQQRSAAVLETPLQQSAGSLWLDLHNHSLWREERSIPLRPKVFAVLQTLMARPGQLISGAEMHRAVWGATQVSAATLKNCVLELRAALGDSSQAPCFLQTVPRRGYCLLKPIPMTPLQQVWQLEPRRAKEAEPVQLHSMVPPYFVGRETERALLANQFLHAASGMRQCVLLTGETGVGKTTLVRTFLSSLMAESSVWLVQGRCVEHYGAQPLYLPILDALEQLGHSPERPLILEMLRRYAPSWLQMLPALSEDRGHESEARPRDITTREGLQREFALLLEALAFHRPLVLWLDDLHWADVSTLDLVGFVTRRLEPARLFVLGAFRPGDALAREHPIDALAYDLLSHNQAVELKAPALTLKEIQLYLSKRFHALTGSQSQAVAQWVWQRTEGNPLFVETVTEDLAAQGVFAPDNNGWPLPLLQSGVPSRIPERLQQMIARMIRRLSSRDWRLLSAASVVGMEFSAAAVAAATGDPVGEVDAACSALAAQQLFITWRDEQHSSERRRASRYLFLHSVYRDAVYQALSLAQRGELHLSVATWMETAYGSRLTEHAGALAEHFERGHDLLSALRYRKLSAEVACQRLAYQEASTHLTQALELAAHLPVTREVEEHILRLLLRLGPLQIAQKGWSAAEVVQTYRKMLQLCQEEEAPAHRFAARFGLWVSSYSRAELKEAQRYAEELLSLAHESGDPELLMEAHHAIGNTLFRQGYLQEARRHLVTSTEMYDAGRAATRTERYGVDDGVTTLGYLAWLLWTLGYADQAQATTQRMLMLAQSLGHPLNMAWALNSATWHAVLRRDFHYARERAEAGIALCTEHGFAQLLATASIAQGWVDALNGHPMEGIAQMQQGNATLEAMEARISQPLYLAKLAEAHAWVGEVTTGLEVVGKMLAAGENSSGSWYEAELRRLQGELLLQGALRRPTRTQMRAAEQYFTQAIVTARGQEAKMMELRATVSLCRLWQRQKKQLEARRALAEIYGWFTEGFDTKDLQEAKALLEELA